MVYEIIYRVNIMYSRKAGRNKSLYTTWAPSDNKRTLCTQPDREHTVIHERWSGLENRCSPLLLPLKRENQFLVKKRKIYCRVGIIRLIYVIDASKGRKSFVNLVSIAFVKNLSICHRLIYYYRNEVTWSVFLDRKRYTLNWHKYCQT